MSITDRIPALRGRHRAIDRVAELQAKNTHLKAQVEQITWALTRALLAINAANQARDAANAKATRLDEAEAAARKLRREMAELKGELYGLRAFRANTLAVTPLPPHLNHAPPPLTLRFEHGPVVRLGASPHADTSPAHVPTRARDDDTAA